MAVILSEAWPIC